jgi:PmbA protein
MALGAADAEAVFLRGKSLDIQVARAKVESCESSETSGMGIRVFTKDRRMGFAWAGGPFDPAAVAAQALDNAEAGDPDPCNLLPETADSSEDDWTQDNFDSVTAEDKIAFALDMERKALAQDSRVARVHSASYDESQAESILLNSRGACRVFRAARASCSLVAVAEIEGTDAEMAGEFDSAWKYADLRADWVATEAARRAVASLGGTPIEGGVMPVVLENGVATEFLGVIVSGLSASNVIRGKSLFAGLEGESVAAECISIFDQNDLAEGLNRRPFDSEGVGARRKTLMENGILRGFLHNTYTAAKMGCETTANAVRGGFRGTPEVGPSNLYFGRGEKSPEQLLETACDGLFVTDAMGVHTADPVSGDFSFGASGFLIKSGRVDRPVRGVTIAGNIRDLLRSIQATGSDLRFYGACGAPSLLVSGIMVSGA